MKIWLKRILAAVMLVAVTGAFFGLPTAIACKAQPAISWTFLAVLLLTPLFGRLFCETMCPLGILQSVVNRIVHPKTAVRRVCTRLPQSGLQFAVRWLILGVFVALVLLGFGGAAWMLLPYSIYGKALTMFVPGVVLFAAIILLAAATKGRFWCNWVCPAGTLFNLLSWRSVCCHKVGPGCANCKACFPKKAAASENKPEQAPSEGVTRREVLQGMGVVAAVSAVEKTTDGGYALVSLPGVPDRPAAVLPPGARDRELFNTLCVGCGLCIANCPGECLVASTKLKTFGQPEMSFQRGGCLVSCPQKCAQACPAGAIVRLADVPRKDIHMGHAIWRKDLCLRNTEGVQCKACSRKCPVKAIEIVNGFPVVDKEKCIGCGVCESVCPSRPMPAIIVKGFDRQRVVRPFNSDDLLSEMTRLVRDGVSVVAARDGVITAQETGKGMLPIMSLFEKRALARAVVVDKVVGLAAASVCVVGKARRVHALIMSEDAMALLKASGIEASAEEVVPQILDRDMAGRCPMEQAVDGRTTPEEMVAALREKMGLPPMDKREGHR